MKTEKPDGHLRTEVEPIDDYRDPVCGMDAVGTTFELVRERTRFHFCGASCLDVFRKNSERFGKTE